MFSDDDEEHHHRHAGLGVLAAPAAAAAGAATVSAAGTTAAAGVVGRSANRQIPVGPVGAAPVERGGLLGSGEGDSTMMLNGEFFFSLFPLFLSFFFSFFFFLSLVGLYRMGGGGESVKVR